MSDRVDRIIAVLQASKLPGAVVQWRLIDMSVDIFTNTLEPVWNFDRYEYRIFAPTEGKTRHSFTVSEPGEMRVVASTEEA